MPPPPDANFAASTRGRDSAARPLRGRNRCPYAVSKAGLEMLVKIYAGEIARTRVRANLIDPGIVRTRLRARAFPGEDPSRLPPPESVADAFLTLALPECACNGEVVIAAGVSLP